MDETYNENKVALFRVQGMSPDNMQAIQVDQVCSSRCIASYFITNYQKIGLYEGLKQPPLPRD